jgi:acetyl CoA:N6-hydroxylysine acetyl transferase
MSELPSPWAIHLPGAAHCLCFTPADPDRHAVLLHDWFHRAHVISWWGPDRTVAETRDYLVRQRQAPHLTPWLVSLWGTPKGVAARWTTPAWGVAEGDDMPFGYVETYRAVEDRLAQFTPLESSDRGWHVLVGLRELLGSGVPRQLGRGVLARLLSEPGVDRVVCEPNEKNRRMLGFCHALGFHQVMTVELPEKRAALLACTRESFRPRWPGDLEAGAASFQKETV